MDKKKILDYQSIKKKIRRISLQILESNIDQDEIIIAGIDVNGFIIAKKISQEIRKISDINIKLCKIKIDKKNPLNDISISLNFEIRGFAYCSNFLAFPLKLIKIQSYQI